MCIITFLVRAEERSTLTRPFTPHLASGNVVLVCPGLLNLRDADDNRCDITSCANSPPQVLTQALNFAMVLSTALMMWKGLSVVCNTDSPVVVVLRYVTRFLRIRSEGMLMYGPRSESMEPAIQRGDLLFLTMPRHAPLKHGDITVYKVPGSPIPIVHRVIETHDEFVPLVTRRPASRGKRETDGRVSGRTGRTRQSSGY